MTSSAAAVSLAIVAAVILVVGTAVAVWLDVLHRHEVEKNKKTTTTMEPESEPDDDAPENTVQEENSSSIQHGSDDYTQGKVQDLSWSTVRFPTVSAATARFKSSSYNIFVWTTTVHGGLLQVFNFWYLDEIDNREEDVTVLSYCATIGLIVVNAFLWLMSLIPAKGKGTIPHIVCGMVYFQAGICWMVWVSMLTRRLDLGIGYLVVQVVLCGMCILAAIWAYYFVNQTMKRHEKGTGEWKLSLHKGACGQFTFGICYAIFIIVTTASVA